MKIKKGNNPSSFRSRQALAGSFISQLQKRPIGDITIEDITSAAGLSRQTFYTNFERKEDILEYALEKLFQMLSQSLCTEPLSMEELLSEYFCFWCEHCSLPNVLFGSHLAYLFAIQNQKLFSEELSCYAGKAAKSQEEQPYLESYLSGLTYQVLWTGFTRRKINDAGEMTAVSRRLLKGQLFQEGDAFLEERS